jgi:hypothetical protein
MAVMELRQMGNLVRLVQVHRLPSQPLQAQTEQTGLQPLDLPENQLRFQQYQ